MMPDSPAEKIKLRVMVDANILVAGSIWPRFPYAVLHHATIGDYRLVLSPEIIAEARNAIDASPLIC